MCCLLPVLRLKNSLLTRKKKQSERKIIQDQLLNKGFGKVEDIRSLIPPYIWKDIYTKAFPYNNDNDNHEINLNAKTDAPPASRIQKTIKRSDPAINYLCNLIESFFSDKSTICSVVSLYTNNLSQPKTLPHQDTVFKIASPNFKSEEPAGAQCIIYLEISGPVGDLILSTPSTNNPILSVTPSSGTAILWHSEHFSDGIFHEVSEKPRNEASVRLCLTFLLITQTQKVRLENQLTCLQNLCLR